jgi:hypothetical protein
VLVDCVTYVVCSSAGLDVGDESIPYIAGWGEDGAIDAIHEYAETIDAIARRIEDALGDSSARQLPAGTRQAARQAVFELPEAGRVRAVRACPRGDLLAPLMI